MWITDYLFPKSNQKKGPTRALKTFLKKQGVAPKRLKKVAKQAAKAVGSHLGARIGQSLGMPGGAKAGQTVAAKMARLMGSGDYAISDTVEENSLFGNRAMSRGASANATFSSSSGGLRLKHREYLNDVFTGAIAGAFSNVTYQVNPGLASVFPFLSQIAANYEQYRFHGLVFEFISSTAPYGVTSLGTYVMAMAYNAAAPAYTSKPQIENSDYALSGRLDKSGMYGVECAEKSQATEYLYVRAPGQTTPVNLLDLGLFQMVTVPGVGLAPNSALGELWVTYDIELIRPRISASRYGYAHFTGSLPTAGSPLGTTSITDALYGSLAGTTLASGGARLISFPSANVGDTYLVSLSFVGTAPIAVTQINVTAYTGLVLTNVLANGTTGTAGAPNPAAAISQTMIQQFYLTVTAEAPIVPSIQFGGAGVPPTLGTVDITILDLGNGLIGVL